MKTSIIRIGRSQGIRIPKPFLEESGITDEVELTVGKGEIKITAIKKTRKRPSETVLLSESALMKDWSRPEEDAAWANL